MEIDIFDYFPIAEEGNEREKGKDGKINLEFIFI